MTVPATDLFIAESRAARRLARLFRIERHGGFDRWPAATVSRLIERRGMLVKDLKHLNGVRRSLPATRSSELDAALKALETEVNRAINPTRSRVEQIGGDLRSLTAARLPTGIRDTGRGQLLGKT